MKKNDLAAIILIAAVALAVSYFLANTIIGQPQNDPVSVEVVQPIDDTFTTPDSRIFNDKAIDPTVEIPDGTPSTNQPFGN